MASQRKSAAHLKYPHEHRYKRTSHVFLQEYSQKSSLQDAREAIEGILARGDSSILYKESILNSALWYLQLFDSFHTKYENIAGLRLEDSHINLQQPKSLTSQHRVSQQFKPKKQECPFNLNQRQNCEMPRAYFEPSQQQKCRKKHNECRLQLKKERNLMDLPGRYSETQDYSQQIQQLLRRKKELLLSSRQNRNKRQEEADLLKTKKRKDNMMAKTDYIYDYDGQRYEYSNKERNYTMKNAQAYFFIVKVNEETQIVKLQHLNMKKKTVVQVNKSKKRKQLQNTCELSEDAYQSLPKGSDLGHLISISTNASRGVRFLEKSRKEIQVLRFPLVR